MYVWVTSRFTKVLTINFPQKSQQTNPLQFPQKGSYKRETCLQGICISLKNLIFQVPR
jgi:hypothetical protein